MQSGKPSAPGSEPSALVPIPGARTALILLLSINLFNYIDRQVLAAVVPEIRHEFFGSGQSPGPVVQTLLDGLKSILGGSGENALIGSMNMAFMVTYMLFAVVFGALRIKRWWIIAGGVALWSLASGFTGLAGTFGILLLTRCFVGIGEAAYGPVAPTMISDLYPESARGRILSWFYMAIPVGSALGFVLGGLVNGWLGWRWAFYLVVPPGLILALLALFMREPRSGEADGSKHKAEEYKPSWQDYKRILSVKSFAYAVAGMTAMTFAIGGIGFWMPSYIHEYRGVKDLAQVNMIFGAILVTSGLSATLIGGMVADWLRKRYAGSYFLVSAIGLLLAVPCCIAIVYVPFPTAWVFIFLACFALFFNTGPSNAILANVTHPLLRPAAFALSIFITHALGDVISPLVIGAITDASGGNMDVSMIVVSLTCGLGGLIWLFGAHHLKGDSERALKMLDR